MKSFALWKTLVCLGSARCTRAAKEVARFPHVKSLLKSTLTLVGRAWGGGFRGLCGCASLKQHPTKLRPAGFFLGTVSCAPLPMCGKRFVCQSAHVGQNQTTRGLQVLVHVSIYWTRVHVGHISLTHSHEPTPEPKRAKEGPAFPGADGGAEAGGFEPNASLEAALGPRTTSKTDTPSYK